MMDGTHRFGNMEPGPPHFGKDRLGMEFASRKAHLRASGAFIWGRKLSLQDWKLSDILRNILTFIPVMVVDIVDQLT